MPVRLKRLIGTCLIVLFVLFYALIAAFVGDAVAKQEPFWLQILYFAVAGLVWTVPVGALIFWMYRPIGGVKRR